MRSERGITLIEVLASVLILSMVVLSVSYLFTQSYQNSYQEENKDVSVQIGRTIIEELKQDLRTARPSRVLYGQTIDLAALRRVSATTDTLPSIYYPSSDDRQYEIRISNVPFTDRTYPFRSDSKTFEYSVREYFSLIELEIIHLNPVNTYRLQSYIEKR